MSPRRKRHIPCLLLALCALLLVPALANAERDFPLLQAPVTDFTGSLADTDLVAIRQALDEAYRANGMDGHVIIALRTEEWYLDEYVKDYADFLQGRGLIEPAGWLLYISTADRKFALAVQDLARKSITVSRKQEIDLILSERLDSGDVAGAILGSIEAIGKLEAPRVIQEKRKISPDMLVFMGIAVMVVALMLRLRHHARRGVLVSRR